MKVRSLSAPLAALITLLSGSCLGKILALFNGAALLWVPHPFLPGTYSYYVVASLCIELMLLGTFCLRKTKVFLLGSLGLGILFVSYHLIQSNLRVAGPCPCFGGLFGQSSQLKSIEDEVSLVSAFGILVASFLAACEAKVLYPYTKCTNASTDMHSRRRYEYACAAALWGISIAIFHYLWSDRVAGGDEGLEAAKTLQWIRNSDRWVEVWNDQPATWTIISGWIMQRCGPTLEVGRAFVSGICCLVPLTLAGILSEARLRYGGAMAALLVVLSQYTDWNVFMVEGPTYAIALSSCLPLILFSSNVFGMIGAGILGLLSISIKFTAVFGLIPAGYLIWSRGWKQFVVWSGAIFLGILVLSQILPGWSWHQMGAAHISAAGQELHSYRLRLTFFADNWFLVLLAAVSLAIGYVNRVWNGQLEWFVILLVTVAIHVVHQPYWGYYRIHMSVPLSVLGVIGSYELWSAIRLRSIPVKVGAVGSILALCAIWVEQRLNVDRLELQQAQVYRANPILKWIKNTADKGYSVYSVDPLWTFAAGVPQTPINLTFVSLKRRWSGEIDDSQFVEALRNANVKLIVAPAEFRSKDVWTNYLSRMTIVDGYRDSLVFAARELNLPEQKVGAGESIIQAFGAAR